MVKSLRRKLTVFFAVLLICMSMCATVFAVSGSVNYTAVTYQYTPLVSATSQDAGVTLSVNTSPTTGKAGVYVWIAGSDGFSKIETFPANATRTPMNVSMTQGATYTVHVKAILETSIGTLTYTY